ncbi:MAG TPA: hypothetical protein PK264_22105 [Hyphomicrobiaceae bacterium]|nr:hypothetical protein [Hyphomicrobiaceae bacterium]
MSFDITRCGADWCGVKLGPDKSCGPVALRLAPVPQTAGELSGSLSIDPAAQTYMVRATLLPASVGSAQTLRLIGNPNAPPQPFTRIIQFHDVLSRVSDAMCQAEAKVT